LGVLGTTEIKLSPHRFTQNLPKMADEFCISVRCNRSWNPMHANNILKI